MPPEDDGRRDNPLFVSLGTPMTARPDVAALRAAPTRVVLANGVESAQEMTGRAATAVAELLGTSVLTFPSHHAGFLGGEYGQQGEPEAFATRLREVLDG